MNVVKVEVKYICFERKVLGPTAMLGVPAWAAGWVVAG